MRTDPFHTLLPPPPVGHDWQPVSGGASGDRVYRSSDGQAFAKLTGPDRATVLDGERQRLEWLYGRGPTSPEMLDWLWTEEGACLVMRAVPGVPASDVDAADLVRAWPSLAEALLALHAMPIESCPFERGLATMVARAEDVVARGAVNPDFLAREDVETAPADQLAALRAEVPERLTQEMSDCVVCHGDACLPNLMVNPASLRCTGVIDLGRLGVADRHADLALLLANADEHWATSEQAEAASRDLFRIHGFATPDRPRLRFYLRLDPLTWG